MCADAVRAGSVVARAGTRAMPVPVEMYDPRRNQWAPRANTRTARFDLAAAVVSGVVYAPGGVDLFGRAPTVKEAYTP